MLNIVKNELIKVFKSKRIYILMGLIVILTAVPCIANLILGNNNDPLASGQMLPYNILMMYIEVILPMFITVLVCDMYTEEYANGTLKLQMIHPITRGKLLISKVIALGITILVLLLFSMFIGYILGTLIFGWGNLFEVHGITYSTGNGILLTIGSYMISLIPLLSYGLFMLLLGMQFNSGGAAVGTGIGIFLILTYIYKLIESSRPYLIINYFDLHSLLVKGFDFSTLGTYLGVLSIYGFTSYLIGYFQFTRKDILY